MQKQQSRGGQRLGTAEQDDGSFLKIYIRSIPDPFHVTVRNINVCLDEKQLVYIAGKRTPSTLDPRVNFWEESRRNRM